MAYRKFDTGTWQDPWFEELNPKAKLLFIYLWGNDVCNQSGMYKISRRRMEFELGFSINGVIETLADKIYWDPDRQIVWVKNFVKWQCQNESFLVSALKAAADMPEDLHHVFISYNRKIIDKYGLNPENHGLNTNSPPCQPDDDTITPPCQHGVDTNPASEQKQNRTEAETEAEAATEQECQLRQHTPVKKIMDIWNEAVDRNRSTMPKVMAINRGTGRYNHVRARWKENPDFDTWGWMAEQATSSDFMNGRTRSRDRPMSFDWIVESAGNFTKVLEGKYTNTGNGNGHYDGLSPTMRHNVAAAEAFINGADDG